VTPKATQFLDRIASWAQNRDDVNLILLLGSQARADDPADQFSDVDIVLGCLEPRRYLDYGDWIGALDKPLLTFVEPTATGGELERRVLFANGLDVDVSLIAMATLRLWAAEGMPPDVLPVIRRGMRAVLDREGLAPRLSAQAGSSPPIAAVPSEGEFAERTHDFLYHCLWTARKAARGELFMALQCLDGPLRKRLFELARISGNLADGTPTTWYGARMIESRLDAGTLAKLAATCAIHDRTSIVAALNASMDLHASFCREIAKRLAFTYPLDAEASVRRMIAST